MTPTRSAPESGLGFVPFLEHGWNTTNQKYSPGMRERALRILDEAKASSEHSNLMSAVRRVEGILGMSTETLRAWHDRREVGAAASSKVPSDVAEENMRLCREVAEVRKANEIFKAASVFSAKELDQP